MNVKFKLIPTLDIVKSMPISQADRKRLFKQIDMAEQYQKIRHSGHCSDGAECDTHCIMFGLSELKCAQHFSHCNHAHSSHCSDCMNIIAALDKISQHIEKITDKKIAQEAKFDFENASEHTIEWLRHNLRAARQDCEKKFIISQMEEDKAFCTFDWGQKILPQKYREAQCAYFGKKEMSVLVDSLIWNDSTANLANTAATTTSLSPPSYCTESYNHI